MDPFWVACRVRNFLFVITRHTLRPATTKVSLTGPYPKLLSDTRISGTDTCILHRSLTFNPRVARDEDLPPWIQTPRYHRAERAHVAHPIIFPHLSPNFPESLCCLELFSWVHSSFRSSPQTSTSRKYFIGLQEPCASRCHYVRSMAFRLRSN